VCGHFVNRRDIECRREADGLGKLRRAVHHNAMQRLAPPVVCWNAQAWNGPSLIHKLRNFFFQRHAVYKVRGALLGCEFWIHERQFRNVLPGCSGCEKDEKHEEEREYLSYETIHISPL